MTSPHEVRSWLARASGRTEGDPDVAAILGRAAVIRRRRRMLRTTGAAGGVAALVLAVVVVAVPGRPTLLLGAPDAEVITSSAPVADPPSTLHDSTAPGRVPPGVRARVAEEVVAARTDQTSDAPCTLDGFMTPEANRREDALAAQGDDSWQTTSDDVGTTALQVVPAPLVPPGWDDTTVAVLCLDGAPGSSGTTVHLWDGLVINLPTGGWVTAIAAPPGATSALVDRGGWWLAVPASAAGWALVHSPEPDGAPTYPGVRAVWVDDAGTALATRAVTAALTEDSPIAAERSVPGATATLPAAQVGGTEPVLVAAPDDPRLRAWVVEDVDEGLVAVDAAGLAAADVPPLGWVAACGDGTLGGTSGSRWSATGHALGPGVDLPRWGATRTGDQVVIDFGDWQVPAAPQEPDATADPVTPEGPCPGLADDPFDVESLLDIDDEAGP